MNIDEWAKGKGHENPPFPIILDGCENLYIYWLEGKLYIHQLKK